MPVMSAKSLKWQTFNESVPVYLYVVYATSNLRGITVYTYVSYIKPPK